MAECTVNDIDTCEMSLAMTGVCQVKGRWEPTPLHFLRLDIRWLLQEDSITEVRVHRLFVVASPSLLGLIQLHVIVH